jgi:hypothetical protein
LLLEKSDNEMSHVQKRDTPAHMYSGHGCPVSKYVAKHKYFDSYDCRIWSCLDYRGLQVMIWRYQHLHICIADMDVL